MHRRLYFLFPEVEHARRVVEELEQAGVDNDHIHAMARPEIDLSSLPRATPNPDLSDSQKNRPYFLTL